jgi:precorrin-2 dehydrogenase/sirohydrochlorin ferrochelatase
MSGLYSTMLRVAGRMCVVVGGGQVATRKITRLLEAGAAVTVVAPDQSPQLKGLVQRGLVKCQPREYQRGDLARAVLAFAATDSPVVNAAIADEADSLRIPVNVADDPAASTFQVPAVIERDGLTLAISTHGRSPSFARRLREQLEALLSPEKLTLLELYAELRTSLAEQGRQVDGTAWSRADDRTLELIRDGRLAEARRVLREQVLVGEAEPSEA